MTYKFPVLRKNWIVQCPNPECGVDIARIKQDTFPGDWIYCEDLTGLDRAVCDNNCIECYTPCREPSGRGVHIKNRGWIDE